MKKLLHRKKIAYCLKLSFMLGFLLMTFVSISIAKDATAQDFLDKRITLNFEKREIERVLTEIEQQAGISFTYRPSLFSKTEKITIKATNEPLSNLLSRLLSPLKIKYTLVNNQLILTKDTSLGSTISSDIESIDVIKTIDKTIKGTVSDEKGEKLIGVTVTLKGTTKGVMTDIEGQYSINIPSNMSTAILVFSFVGYQAQEIQVGASASEINVVMKEDYKALDEVVVVGFGTQKKANLTGSVSTINMKDVLGDRPVTNVSDALLGVIPGLQITSGGGQPGTLPVMNIRGTTSLSADGTPVSSSPLILMDNIPVDINSINPMDVESITVLKDAAAASIYGARAAFGVILITTKKGSRNQAPKLEYSTNFAWTHASTLPKKVSPEQFIKSMNDFGTVTYWGGQSIQRWGELLTDYNANPSKYPDGYFYDKVSFYPLREVDLYKSLFPGGNEQTHNLSITGGTEKSTYRVSLGYTDQDGIMVTKRDNYNRYNLNTSLTTSITPWLSATVSTMYANDKQISPANQSFIFYMGLTMPPMVGTGNVTLDNGDVVPFSTPDAIVKNEYPSTVSTNNLRLFGKLEVTPLKDLRINGEFTYNYIGTTSLNTQAANIYASPVIYSPGILNNISGQTSFAKEVGELKYNAINLYANYTKTLNDHSLGLMLGLNNESNNYSDIYTSRLDLLSLDVPAISTATGTISSSDSLTQFRTLGYFGRINYNFKNKYIFEANGRYDGSSRFPQSNRYGFFPSFSAGWVLSNEPFFKNVEKITELKLRVSWGRIGNQNIADYSYIPSIATNPANWINPSTRIRYLGLSTPNLIRNNFTWETVQTADAGIDFGLWKNKLTGSFDYFIRKTYNILAPGSILPATLGAAAPLQNVSDIESKGWEVQLLWRDNFQKFRYSVGVNLADNFATVTKYDNPSGLLKQPYVGMQVGQIWGFQTQGYFTTDDFVENTLNSGLLNGKLKSGIAPFKGVAQNPGDIRYVDINGDGIISNGANTLSNHGDLIVIGNNTRRYQFGLTGSLGYGPFDLSVFAQGVGKRDVWLSNNSVAFPYQGQFNGLFANQLDYWTPTNVNAYFARVYKDGAGNNSVSIQPQTKYLFNGSYLRIKNITLGYTLPNKFISKLKLTKGRAFVSAENFFTFNNLPAGIDAEAATINSGGIYPFAKKISVGLTISL